MRFRKRQRKIEMIFYSHPITYDDLILSIDNAILDVSLPDPAKRDLLQAMISTISHGNKVEMLSWESHKPGTFRYQTLFRISDGRAFWLGQGLNSNGVLIERYRLDFNPNKVANDPNFQLILNYLVRNSRASMCRIARFDLAVDIPVDRAKCFLIKDRRLYIERRHGVEYTQYLGSKSSTVGRVKLYNKTAEAKLDYPLTRLELTLDPATPYEKVNFPTVYHLNSSEMDDDRIKATDTETFILNALLQGYGKLNDLGRKTRAKIETLMKNYVKQIRISPEVYEKVLALLADYLVSNNEQLDNEMEV